MNIWLIIALVYVALDIVTGLALYIHIRRKGWSKFDLAVNFRNLLRKGCQSFKESVATQIGYADYDETYNAGYNDGHTNGFNEGYEDAKEEIRMEEERKKMESARQNAIKSILGIFNLLGL